jgi:hypothetical protein
MVEILNGEEGIWRSPTIASEFHGSGSAARDFSPIGFPGEPYYDLKAAIGISPLNLKCSEM